MPTGTQNARVLTNGFFAAVSGDTGKCFIDIDNSAMGIGDTDSLTGVGENTPGKLKLFVVLLTPGD